MNLPCLLSKTCDQETGTSEALDDKSVLCSSLIVMMNQSFLTILQGLNYRKVDATPFS